jgi:hypothetical protein
VPGVDAVLGSSLFSRPPADHRGRQKPAQLRTAGARHPSEAEGGGKCTVCSRATGCPCRSLQPIPCRTLRAD